MKTKNRFFWVLLIVLCTGMPLLAQESDIFLTSNYTVKKYFLPQEGTSRIYVVRSSDGKQVNEVRYVINPRRVAEGFSCWLKITPLEPNRCLMDVFLLGNRYLYHDVLLPFDIEEIPQLGVEKIYQYTKSFVDWRILLPVPNRDENIKISNMINLVQKALPYINYKEGGIINSEGKYVHIDTGLPLEEPLGLNNFGFTKWIVDGVCKAKGSGLRTDIDFLKIKHFETRGNSYTDSLEMLENPFFGLDFCRNLAYWVAKLDNEQASIEDSDMNYLDSVYCEPSSGFPIRDLEFALFQLAAVEPGNFYLASINGNVGVNNDIRKHYHTAVLFPYFSQAGRLTVAVFKSCREVSFEEFLVEYKGEHVHLSKVRAGVEFLPDDFVNLSVLKR